MCHNIIVGHAGDVGSQPCCLVIIPDFKNIPDPISQEPRRHLIIIFEKVIQVPPAHGINPKIVHKGLVPSLFYQIQVQVGK